VKPKVPAEKAIAANGRKPPNATSEPLFQLIWRRATKELKRRIFFVNPFPDTESYEALPMDVYTAATEAISEKGCYKKSDVEKRAQAEYSIEWSSSVSR
jgi:hypothetical protein